MRIRIKASLLHDDLFCKQNSEQKRLFVFDDSLNDYKNYYLSAFSKTRYF